MKKLTFFLFASLIFLTKSQAQIYMADSCRVSFFSAATIEDITAVNTVSKPVMSTATGDIQISITNELLMFKKKLMQEHFNENYVESDKYPKATFSGAYTGDVPLDKDGVYKVTVNGRLTLHNVTRTIETAATLEVKGGHLLGVAEFKVKPEDFNIGIPSIVRDKIDKEIMVKVNIDCTTNK